jgi:hypothetical protein
MPSTSGLRSEGGSTYNPDWFTPNERRIDGDRITELIPSREWLSGREPGNRGPDVNPLVPSSSKYYPPVLPRHMRRDHLHDRNREHALFDSANPGLASYVRVTRRRRNDPVAETALARSRQETREAELAKERDEVRTANELLELRSQGLRKAMAQKSRLNAAVAAGMWRPPSAPSGPDPTAVRVDLLEQRLQMLMRTSGMQYVQQGLHQNQRPATAPSPPKPSGLAAMKPKEAPPPPPPADPWAAEGRALNVLRSRSGGARGSPPGAVPGIVSRSGWPVEMSYFKHANAFNEDLQA